MPDASAVEAIGVLAPGVRRFGIARGQFSLGDLIVAILEQTGPAHLTISTWTAGIRDARSVEWLLQDGRIKSLRLIVDRSFRFRQPKYADEVERIFGAGAVRETACHAKFALIEGGGLRICVRSSMNLNRNRRFEQFDLDEGDPVYSVFAEFADEVFSVAPEGLSADRKLVDRAFREIMPPGEREQPTDLDAAETDMLVRLAIAEPVEQLVSELFDG